MLLTSVFLGGHNKLSCPCISVRNWHPRVNVPYRHCAATLYIPMGSLQYLLGSRSDMWCLACCLAFSWFPRSHLQQAGALFCSVWAGVRSYLAVGVVTVVAPYVTCGTWLAVSQFAWFPWSPPLTGRRPHLLRLGWSALLSCCGCSHYH